MANDNQTLGRFQLVMILCHYYIVCLCVRACVRALVCVSVCACVTITMSPLPYVFHRLCHFYHVCVNFNILGGYTASPSWYSKD